MMSRQVRDPINRSRSGSLTEANELPYARTVAKAIGAEHRDVTVTPSASLDALPHLVWHEDEPIAFPSSVPLLFRCEAGAQSREGRARPVKARTELFLGYNRLPRDDVEREAGAAVLGGDAAGAAIRYVACAGAAVAAPGGSRAYVPGARPGYSQPLPRKLRCAHGGFPADAARAAGNARHARSVRGGRCSVYAGAKGISSIAMSRTDLQTYLHELLMKQDQ